MKGIFSVWILYNLDFSRKEQAKKRKYHMIKCEALNRPKEFGGLRFMDVRVMNTCLYYLPNVLTSLREGIIVYAALC
jgi:hypothetical protein